jgi:hypothetical protein
MPEVPMTWRLLTLGLCAALASCLITDFDPEAGPFPCTTDSDCVDGWRCVQAVCTVGAASSDADALPDAAPHDAQPNDGAADGLDSMPDVQGDAPSVDVPVSPDAMIGCTDDSDCPGSPCSEGVCTDGACAAKPLPDETPCTSPDPCLLPGTCLAGECQTAPDPCDDGNPCTADQCTPGAGCAHTPLSGKPCEDDDPCTVGGICADGTCGGGAPACDDGVACTKDICLPTGACTHTADHDSCQPSDLCKTYQCHPTEGCTLVATVLCDDGNACNGKEFCEPATGTCKPGFAVTCEDNGNICDGTTWCNPATGGCEVLPPPECPKGSLCLGLWSCDPQKGCVLSDPQPCEDGDGNVCNGTVACDPATGTCQPSLPSCDQGDLPTCVGLRQCDPELGCVVVPSGQSCCASDADCSYSACILGACVDGKCQPAAPVECDDGNVCNGPEACDPELGCVSGEPLVCDDGNPCNGVGTCDPVTGCVPGPPPTCDDGNVCNGAETCAPAVGCKAGEPLQCSDGNVCNGLEACDPETGCMPGEVLHCDDGNPCNGLEYCVPETGCGVGGAPFSGCCTKNDQCDDGNPCNGSWHCEPQGGACVLDVAPLSCNDGDPCTADACDPATGCVNAPVPGCGP